MIIDPRKEKFLKIALYALGGIAGLVFLITKSRAALDWATAGDYQYGDLYRFAHVRRFRPAVPLPTGKTDETDSIDHGVQCPGDHDLIFLGDSFGFNDYGESPFYAQLGAELGTTVFSVSNNRHREFCKNPYLLFQNFTAKTQPKRILVYEIVERFISERFSSALSPAKPEIKPSATPSFLSRASGKIGEFFPRNSDERYDVLFKHSFLTSPLTSLLDSALFESIREISPETPLYSLHPPFLFYKDEVSCFESNHSDQLVSSLADHIALLDENLRKQFNCDLVFVPVPNKITVYSQLATNQPYDEFLPRLCEAVKSRNVYTVDILPKFRRENGLLYYPSDTHWNDRGIQIAVQQTLETCRQAEAAEKQL